MKIKEYEYIKQTLERYTNCRIEDICDHILITNFKQYIMRFKEETNGEYAEGNFGIVNAKDINCTMIDFGIGSPQAALVINCLAYLENLKTVIMLGMCGGIDDVLEEGDFIVPSAAIRGEGASNHYLPPEFPAIPASSVNLYCIGAVRQIGLIPRCGIIYTTDRRLWEFDEGSIMLVSDMPLQRRGIKDKKKQDQVFSKYLEPHLDLAFDAVKNMDKKWSDLKRRLSSEW
jgi:AMP nucleosidase